MNCLVIGVTKTPVVFSTDFLCHPQSRRKLHSENNGHHLHALRALCRSTSTTPWLEQVAVPISVPLSDISSSSFCTAAWLLWYEGPRRLPRDTSWLLQGREKCPISLCCPATSPGTTHLNTPCHPVTVAVMPILFHACSHRQIASWRMMTFFRRF